MERLRLGLPDGFEIFHEVTWHSVHEGIDRHGEVNIKGKTGILIQCKSSSIPGQNLGWDAVKEVVAGTAAYKVRHAGVDFAKIAATNQYFNGAAKEQAHLNGVDLVDCTGLVEMLVQYPVSRRFLA